jgi:hypothetical protein
MMLSFDSLFKIARKAKRIYKRNTLHFNKGLISGEQANKVIKSLIVSEKPSMISRLGVVEINCIRGYFNHLKWSLNTRNALRDNAGVFPVADDECLELFSRLYLTDIELVDLMGISFNTFEDYLCNNYCPGAELSLLRNLEPYYHDSPWSETLRDMSVLVIHPFKESIEHQYHNKRELLFMDSNILPKFELKTIAAVQSISGAKTEYRTWFDALDSMKEQIDKTSYDIAIIGAGAYGLPLAAHVKRSGRKAIHLGGSTQILFGIRGKRWDNHPEISRMYNANWIRPNVKEKPDKFEVVEQGCYW